MNKRQRRAAARTRRAQFIEWLNGDAPVVEQVFAAALIVLLFAIILQAIAIIIG